MIASNDDTTKWKDGQEQEFLALCAVNRAKINTDNHSKRMIDAVN
jgi:hypothetical protein